MTKQSKHNVYILYGLLSGLVASLPVYRGGKIRCISSDDPTGLYYRGRRRKTVDGDLCKKWDLVDLYRYKRLLYKANINADKLQLPLPDLDDRHHGHCRNPDGKEFPWCYLRHPSKGVYWQYCTDSRLREIRSCETRHSGRRRKPMVTTIRHKRGPPRKLTKSLLSFGVPGSENANSSTGFSRYSAREIAAAQRFYRNLLPDTTVIGTADSDPP